MTGPFAEEAEFWDRQIAAALACPPDVTGDRVPLTPFQRWYWENLGRYEGNRS